jgi:hypothetical protein
LTAWNFQVLLRNLTCRKLSYEIKSKNWSLDSVIWPHHIDRTMRRKICILFYYKSKYFVYKVMQNLSMSFI